MVNNIFAKQVKSEKDLQHYGTELEILLTIDSKCSILQTFFTYPCSLSYKANKPLRHHSVVYVL